MNKPILIMAGGTGGHVFPALAVAEKLKQHNVPVVWLGTKKGIESRLVVEAGIPIHWLSISGLRGKNKLSLLLAPFKLLLACIQAVAVIVKVKPAAVLGMGGFVSGPGGLMAVILGKPLLVHEQNAIPGLTNRLLAKIARHVMTSFPDCFSNNSKVMLIGNPVRTNILNIKKPAERLKARTDELRLLVVGGSLGAEILNNTVPEMLAGLDDGFSISVWHQTGNRNYQSTLDAYQQHKVDGKIVAFIDEMAAAYDWADVVLCRAGAMTISELAIAGVASILIPYPYAVDDHQTANAKFLANENAAILIPQNKLTAAELSTVIKSLNKDKILKMSEAAQQIAKPEAANQVAELCIKAGSLA